MAEVESENAALKEAAQRRSAVLQQSRSFITSYLEVPCQCSTASNLFSTHMSAAVLPWMRLCPGTWQYQQQSDINNTLCLASMQLHVPWRCSLRLQKAAQAI